MIINLPEQTVERLSQYRRILLNYQYLDHAYIFSHNLARVLKTKSGTVRRDLMLIGVSGDVHKGYDINLILRKISEAIDGDTPENICFIGIGNLGRSVANHFAAGNGNLRVVAAFLFDQHQSIFPDVPEYDLTMLSEVIKQQNILICALAVPRDYAREITLLLVNSGIMGILNFTATQLQVPKHVFVEDYDMVAKLEKVSYFMKMTKNHLQAYN